MIYYSGFVFYTRQPDLNKITIEFLTDMQSQFNDALIEYRENDELHWDDTIPLYEAIAFVQENRKPIEEITLSRNYDKVRYLSWIKKYIGFDFYDFDMDEFASDEHLDDADDDYTYTIPADRIDQKKQQAVDIMRSLLKTKDACFSFLSSFDNKYCLTPDQYDITDLLFEAYRNNDYKKLQSLIIEHFSAFWFIGFNSEHIQLQSFIEQLPYESTVKYNKSGIIIYEFEENMPLLR